MTRPSIPIAIVGAGCQFPGGRTLGEFFQFLLGGGDAIADLPPERYDAGLYYDPRPGAYGKSYCWRGAMLDTAAIEAPALPGLPPASAARLDPLQRLSLRVAAETFASAGLSAGEIDGRPIPVILGVSRPNVRTLDRAFAQAAERLLAPLEEAMAGDPRAGEIADEVVRAVRDRHGGAGDEVWPPPLGRQVAGLVASAYRLTGRHAVVDAACASTFAALSTGRRALEQRSADLVLVGAAAMFDPYTLVMFAQSRALTAGGSYPFDARANGFIPGEGAGMFLLERLDDALAHGRRILAVVRAVGGSCDGAGKGTWAPRKEGQILAIERAYAGGEADPAEVELIEAHATSTRLGDATEVAALGEFFARGDRREPLLIGSVKGNIGHALSAAGAAGLAKLLGVFQSGTVPPSIGYSTPNSDIRWERGPLRPVTEPTRAPARVAAIDSFGIGGLNYHVVVEAPPSPARAEELLRRAAAPARSSVAIVGAGSVLPGARTSEEVARVVASGWPGFGRSTEDRPGAEEAHAGRADRPNGPRVARIGDLAPDAQQLRIPPKLLAHYDPLQFLVFEAARRALAEVEPRGALDRKRVAVFIGSSRISDFFTGLTLAVRLPELVRMVDAALDARGLDESARARVLAGFTERAQRLLPALTEESSASVASGLSSRTAKALDVNGPVFTIDSGGTGSSLAALEAGLEALRAGDCDVALVGGGDQALQVAPLPGDGRVRGEGAAVVALRRLDDAAAAGDAVLATVAGLGSSAAGNLADAAHPGSDAVERAAAAALAGAGLSPGRVQYIVADALGPAGAADVAGLERFYGDAARTPLPLGSALALFGDLSGATGVVSLQIALAALRGGAAPPAPALRAALGPVRGRVHAVAEPVPLSLADGAVAVTSGGAWGAQYHVLLGAPPPRDARTSPAPESMAPEPIRFRAPSRAALAAMLQPLRGRDLSHLRPGEVTGRGDVTVALRASSLRDSLEAALALLAIPGGAVSGPGVAIGDAPVPAAACFLFPGLGSPYEGMLRALVDAYPAAARRLAEIDALVAARAGRAMSDVLAREPRLFAETVEWAQYASLTANLVTYEVAAAHGFRPAVVSGHSFGEYAALVVAGAITLEDAVGMAAARAECIARTTRPGAMTSVFASRARVAQLLDGLPGFAAASNVNAPDEVVVSGDGEGTAALLDRCRRDGVQARQLTVPAPFHCELLRPACEPFARAIAQVSIRPPVIPVISTVTSREIDDPEQIRRTLVEQLVYPVDFVAKTECAYARGVRRFVETGAGNVLARLTGKILAGRPAVIASFDERRKGERIGLTAVENALAALRAADGPADLPAAPAVAAGAPRAPGDADASALFTADEWQELARQPDWSAFWAQVRPSLSLLARDLYARNRPAADRAPGAAAASAPSAGSAGPRPSVKVFDATAMRPAGGRRPEQPAAPVEASRPEPATATDRADEATRLITDLVVKYTGYPRELVNFDQELESDLGIDTVKQIELLGAIREELDLPADDSVAVSDLPTLAQLRDYVAGKLSTARPAGAPATAPVAAAPSDEDAVDRAPSGADPLVDDVSGFLTDLVVNQTGYPRELVRFDQELEADLGIDTVKQIELLGAIREKLDLPADEAVSAADLPTLSHLRDYVVGKLSANRTAGPAVTPRPRARASRRHASNGASEHTDEDEPLAGGPLGERIDVASLPGVAAPARALVAVDETSHRFVPRARLEPLPAGTSVYRPAGIVLLGGGAVADELARVLAERGAAVARVPLEPGAAARLEPLLAADPPPDLCLVSACGRADGRSPLVAVEPLLDAGRLEALVDVLAAWLRRAGSTPATLSAVTSLGGFFGRANLTGASLEGAGLVGLLRALRREHPTVRVKAVDVDPWAPIDEIAGALVAELDGASPRLWAGWVRGQRRVPALIPAPLPRFDAAQVERLCRLPYVLLTGGARGITGELAVRLAELGVPRLHLVGRTALPGDLARWQSMAGPDERRERILADLRAGGSPVNPGEWRDAVARVEAALEIDRNLRRIESLGASVRYHAADIGLRPHVAELLDAVRRADGPVRAVVHGAGVQRSRALVGKPFADFRDAIAPKLAGAAWLMELTAGDPIELFVCMSSVAGQFGNHGQTDYGLASAALDALTAAYAAAHPSRRACSMAWPAWDEVGMAVRGGTREQLERRGRRLMSVAEGGNHFLRELLGPPGESAVVIAGPSVNDPDEQRPAPERSDELRDAAERTAPLPLVDLVVSVGPGAIELEHHADAALDRHLADHILGDVALLPGAVSLELMVETAGAARREPVDLIEDVLLAQPFKLARDGRGVLRALARADGDGHAVELVASHIDRAGRMVEPERMLVRGRASRGAGLARALPWRDLPGPAVPYRYRTPADAGRFVGYGPSLHTLIEVTDGDDGWYTARLRALPASALRPRAPAPWRVPAPLLDGCLAACAATRDLRGVPGLPHAFGRLELLESPADGEECRLVIRERPRAGRDAHFDFTARGADGRVLFVVEDYVRRSLG